MVFPLFFFFFQFPIQCHLLQKPVLWHSFLDNSHRSKLEISIKKYLAYHASIQYFIFPHWTLVIECTTTCECGQDYQWKHIEISRVKIKSLAITLIQYGSGISLARYILPCLRIVKIPCMHITPIGPWLENNVRPTLQCVHVRHHVCVRMCVCMHVCEQKCFCVLSLNSWLFTNTHCA